MKFTYVIALLASLPLAACASSGSKEFGQSPGLTVMEDGALPAPVRKDYLESGRAYYIGPYDRLIIDVFGIEELGPREVQVDAGGGIAFPLAGNVRAAGKTPGELAGELRQRLRGAHVRDPQVSVNLKETISQLVTVEGEVKEPGMFPVIGKMTLLRSIAKAKGTSEFAKLDDVVVFRTVDGQRYAALYNLRAIRRGNYDDPEIFANDVVVVGNSKARQLFKDILQTVPLLTTPLVVALQGN